MNVTSETATVWRGGGRRWLTRKAAYHAEAMCRLRRIFCRCRYRVQDGSECDWHSLPGVMGAALVFAQSLEEEDVLGGEE